MKIKSLTLIIISLIGLSIFMACERETVLQYNSFDASLSLKFSNEINNSKAEFTGEIRISTIDGADTTEIKIMELNINQVDSVTYRVVDAIEVPYGEELFISILATLGTEEYKGETTASFEPDTSTEVVIDMVEVNVPVNNPPTCNIISPTDGESFTIGDNVNISATATDSDGTISQVIFYQNGILLDTAYSSPYEYNWNTTSETAGSFILRAVAIDNENAETESSVSVNLTSATNTPPTCNITSPTDGESFTIGDNVNISATATDSDGTISQVIFYQNGVLLDTAYSSPYEYNWNTASETAGTFILRAVAIDNENAETENTVSISLTSSSSFTPTMVRIPEGTFNMGDFFGDGSANELPIHTVTLDSFYIANSEVTQLEYETVIGTNPSDSLYGIGDNYPVNMVSYYDIMVFCNTASANMGLNPCYTILGSTDPVTWGTVPTSTNTDWDAVICDFSVNGYRLPTEAEWEYCAKDGVNWTDSLRYSGCHEDIDLPDYVWYTSNSGGTSHEVGNKLPNQLGLYDMSGNVYEWCYDWYGDTYYASSPASNPLGELSGSYRILKGGLWINSSSYLRTAYRHTGGYPEYRNYNIGFRLVRTAQ